MVDVSSKDITSRIAIASGSVEMSLGTFNLVKSGENAKGHVQSVAEIAGIIAAKKTSDLIPLCHPLPLTKVKVKIDLDESLPGLIVRAEAKTKGQTGVEMEALTAVSVACLTIYDMLKAVEKGLVIKDIQLDHKSGGKSGDWKR